MRRYLDGFLEARVGAWDPEQMPTLDEIKNAYVEYMLDRTFSNKSLAARILNISRTALYDRLPASDRESQDETNWPDDPGASTH